MVVSRSLRADSAKRLVNQEVARALKEAGLCLALAGAIANLAALLLAAFGAWTNLPLSLQPPAKPKLVKTTCHFLTSKPVSTCTTRTHQISAP